MRKEVPTIISESEDYIAVCKPSGMLTLPDRHDSELESLRGWMKKKFEQIKTVHRLDRDTSGLILFAKNEEAHIYYSKLFENRQVKKTYYGIVIGKPVQEYGSITAAIVENPAKKGTMKISKKGKTSRTDYKILKTWNIFSLIEFDLHTGRTHQIRVHCNYLGNPIACDPLYGDGKPVLLSKLKKKFKYSKYKEHENPILNRLGLHSYSLSFIDQKGKNVILEAPLPKDITTCIKQLDKLKIV